MLVRAERLQRQFFWLQRARGVPTWEPPVDILETAEALLVYVALPGVDPDSVEAALEDGNLIVAGARTLPTELRDAEIHRLELPQGRFERHIPLPAGRYRDVRRFAVHGCLVITLAKA
jgi:HSP20 family molecular chaperone IbpA